MNENEVQLAIRNKWTSPKTDENYAKMDAWNNAKWHDEFELETDKIWQAIGKELNDDAAAAAAATTTTGSANAVPAPFWSFSTAEGEK